MTNKAGSIIIKFLRGLFMFFRFLLIGFFLLFSFSSLAIYNLKSNKEALPKTIGSKHWLLVAQGCHSCAELLTDLKTICSGKKPSSSRIGFFAIGSSPKALLNKLKDFNTGYEIFSGSANEFYETYKIMGSPSLKIKAKAKSVSGKDKILSFLKKDSSFCS